MLPSLLDFLFPKFCYGCGWWGEYLCDGCLNKIKINKERICPVCGRGAMSGMTHSFCRRRSLDGLTPIFAYQGLLKKIIKKLKYRFIYEVHKPLVELALSNLGEDETFAWVCRQKPFFVPVPLHPSRERWRGFNQAELLGKPIAENLGLKFISGFLIRVKNTSTQTMLDKKQRQENIKGAFEINPKIPHPSILNSQYLLFDDIWTTGATLNECAKILKQSGAKFVWGLTLAS